MTARPVASEPRGWSYARLAMAPAQLDELACPAWSYTVRVEEWADEEEWFPLRWSANYGEPLHYEGVNRLTRRALGDWLGVSPFKSDREPEPESVARLRAAFAAFDGPAFPAPAGASALQAERWRELRAEGREPARAVLTAAMREGLERVMRPLPFGQAPYGRPVQSHLRGGSMVVFCNLLARGIETPAGLRVCEQCEVVFRAKTRRACRCGECRAAPARVTLKPWHDDFRVGPRASVLLGAPGRADLMRTVTYFGKCKHCGHRYATSHPMRQTCANCGGSRPSSTARARAARGLSRTGRQLFAFAYAPGRPVLSGAAGIETEDGVVRTDDAEVAAELRRLTVGPDPDLVELSDPSGPDPHPNRPACPEWAMTPDPRSDAGPPGATAGLPE